MSISAAFTVDGNANPARHTTTYGGTVNLALTDIAGVGSVQFTIVSSSKGGTTIPTLTESGSPPGSTASFEMPADPGDGLGRTFRIRCVVTSQYETDTTYGVVGVENLSGRLPICFDEERDRSTTGYIDEMNDGLSSLGASVSLSKDANYTIDSDDWLGLDSSSNRLTAIVTDIADITLPSDASRQVGTTVTVIAEAGFFGTVNVLGGGANVQTGTAGQTFTSFPLRSDDLDRSASVTYTWDGTVWAAIGQPGNVGQRKYLSASRDAVLSDAGQVLQCDGGSVVYTIDADTFDVDDEVTFFFTGSSGSLTIAEGTGSITVNVEASKSLVMSTRYTWAFLRCYSARGDTPQLHVVTGELDPV